MSSFTPTSEQDEALALFSSGSSLAIEAGAGTGKTATLILLAGSTRKRGQYVAFNKAIVTESKEKMPSHVACNTAHSLAYRGIIGDGSENGKLYAERLRNSRRMRSSDIAAFLGIDPLNITTPLGEQKQLGISYLAGLSMRTVERFCQSADLEPGTHHVPYIDGIDIPPGNMTNNRIVRGHIIDAVRRAWRDAVDPFGRLPYKHSYYLKQFQLSDPVIGADFILFDEAQDANPVMVAIVAAQRDAQLVWVGDSQQQIYSFTGAVNALENVPAESRTFLTQSFRFGPAIAEVANHVLSYLPSAELRLIGTESIASLVGEVSRPHAILSRTNAAAVRSLFLSRDEGLRAHLVGGGKDVVAFAKGARDLMAGRRTEHPELACFDSWGEVRMYVEQDEQGSDLRLMVNLIDEFGVEEIIDALERMPDERHADLVISTAHKSKGRQWESVQLADDFPAEPKNEELRLLYVAVTRAQVQLDVSRVAFLTESGGALPPLGSASAGAEQRSEPGAVESH